MAKLVRFRLEAEGQTKEGVTNCLRRTAHDVISVANGHLMKTDPSWECTQEAVVGENDSFVGRVVFKKKSENA